MGMDRTPLAQIAKMTLKNCISIQQTGVLHIPILHLFADQLKEYNVIFRKAHGVKNQRKNITKNDFILSPNE